MFKRIRRMPANAVDKVERRYPVLTWAIWLVVLHFVISVVKMFDNYSAGMAQTAGYDQIGKFMSGFGLVVGHTFKNFFLDMFGLVHIGDTTLPSFDQQFVITGIVVMALVVLARALVKGRRSPQTP